jgi:small subunit ribosomal protein S21
MTDISPRFQVDSPPHARIFHALFPTPFSSEPCMPEVQIRKGEPVDRALKRLKTKLEMEGILEEMRRLRSHETGKERTKRKARAAAKRGKIRFRFSMPKPAADAPVAAI